MQFYFPLALVLISFSGLPCNMGKAISESGQYCPPEFCSKHADYSTFINKCPSGCPQEDDYSDLLGGISDSTSKPSDVTSEATMATDPSVTASTPSATSTLSTSTTEIVVVTQELSELDKTLKKWYSYETSLPNEQAARRCNNRIWNKFNDCDHLTTDAIGDNREYTHEEIHNYIYTDYMPAADQYEYYRVASWELGEPPMFSEKAVIINEEGDNETWYRRPLWAKELQVKKEDYPEGFPVEWIWFQEDKKHH